MTDMAVAFITQTGAVDGEYSATGTPFSNDAVTFTSSDPVTSNALSKVVMFGGNDLQVKVGSFTSSATLNGTVSVTSVGFLADVVLVFGARQAMDVLAVNIYNCVGAAIQLSGVVTQGSLGSYEGNGNAVMSPVVHVDNRYACASADGSIKMSVELSAFTSSGFTVTTRQEALAMPFGYMAFRFNGTKIPFLRFLDAPTATGTVATTLTGIKPDFALMLMTLAQAYNVSELDSDANGVGIGLMTPTQSGAVGYVMNDGELTMNSLSWVDASPIRLNSLTGTISHEATVSGMTNDTLSLNYSLASAPVRKWILVGWGATFSTNRPGASEAVVCLVRNPYGLCVTVFSTRHADAGACPTGQPPGGGDADEYHRWRQRGHHRLGRRHGLDD